MFTVVSVARALPAFARAVRDPSDLGGILKLVDQLEARNHHIDVTEALPEERRAALAATQPRLGEIDLDALRALPEGSLGRAYADFLDQHGFAVGDIPAEVPGAEGQGLTAWAVGHLRESHDIWHVVTGFPTDTAGELGLQGFYLAQLRRPLPLLLLIGGLINALWAEPDEIAARMDAIAAGWAAGSAAAPLLGVAWAERWDEPLAEVRAGLSVAPFARAA